MCFFVEIGACATLVEIGVCALLDGFSQNRDFVMTIYFLAFLILNSYGQFL